MNFKTCDICGATMNPGDTSSDHMTVRLLENATFSIGWEILGPQDQCSQCNASLYRKFESIIQEHFKTIGSTSG